MATYFSRYLATLIKTEVVKTKIAYLLIPLLGLVVTTKEIYVNKDALIGVFRASDIDYGEVVGEIITSGQKHGWKYTNVYDIRYIYTVENKTYYANLVDFMGRAGRPVDSYLEKYKVGAKVTVFYNLADPSFAVLDKDSRDVLSLIKLPIFYFMLTTLSIFMFVPRMKRAR